MHHHHGGYFGHHRHVPCVGFMPRRHWYWGWNPVGSLLPPVIINPRPEPQTVTIIQQQPQPTTNVVTNVIQPQNNGPIPPESFSGGDYHSYGNYLHNWFRALHGCPQVKISEKLNQEADALAYRLAQSKSLSHSAGMDWNENLYLSFDKKMTKHQHIGRAVQIWYDDVKAYDFSKPGYSQASSHFTAMMWVGVNDLGIGCWEVDGCIVVSALYKPQSNIHGQFETNVVPMGNPPNYSPPAVTQNTGNSLMNLELHPEAMAEFNLRADKGGDIGWMELKDFLDKNVKIQFKFEGFDKTLVRLLIAMVTLRSGGKNRINLSEFQNVIICMEKVLDSYSSHDKDASGTLDPFELRDAFNDAGFKISYNTFQTAQQLFGEKCDGIMSFRGFFLSFLLLSMLQIAQSSKSNGLPGNLDVKAWMQQQVELASK